jgi:NRPS condensation-like uncharacterized protein
MVTKAPARPGWFPLDNAAMLFPSIESDNRTAVFRLAITLTEEINPDQLQQAVNRIMPRFPTFRVRLVRGLFWNILDTNRNRIDIQQDVRNPCMRLDYRRTRGHLLRVRYFRSRIAVEFFHALTDGHGGMVFLLSLAAEYLRIGGRDIGFSQYILDPSAGADSDELEDSFLRHHRPGVSRPPAEKPAYQVRLPMADPGVVHHIQAKIPAKVLISKAKDAGVTVTSYLAAIYFLALQKKRRLDQSINKPLRICIPVNLRPMFGSRSVRNFAHFVKPVLHPDGDNDYDFDEICQIINHQLALSANRRVMLREFSPNVKAMTSRFLRIMPLFIKNLAIRLVSHSVGEKLFSGMLSNLGRIGLPENMDPFVESIDFHLGPNRKVGSSLSMLGFRDHLRLNFVRTTQDCPIEQEFFRELVRRGIPVRVQSNWR